MRCRGNSTGGSNPSFSATRNAPHWGAFAFQGQAKVTDLERRPRKAKAEQRSCALRVAGSPPPGMYKRAARRQSSFSATRNAPHWGAFALEGMRSGPSPEPKTRQCKSGAAKLRVAGCWSPPPGMYKRAARRQSSFSATRNAPPLGGFCFPRASQGHRP